ncbi:MAG TPA: flagellar biosynthesis protein FliQ [Alphaproteobacteria bacterium]
MELADVLEIARESVIVALKIAAPVMLAGLIVGLAISIFQALTQIQEMTLTFVPKVLVVFTVFILFLPFMVATLVTFTHQLIGRIATLG